MIRLNADPVIYDLGERRGPLLMVEPGEAFEVSTLDAGAGLVLAGAMHSSS